MEYKWWQSQKVGVIGRAKTKDVLLIWTLELLSGILSSTQDKLISTSM